MGETAKFYGVILLILFTLNVRGSVQIEESDSSLILLQKKIIDIQRETKIPAIGVAIVNKTGPIWIGGLGKSDIERDIDANENTIFRIASISKMFTALSVLKLQEEGLLSIQDPIKKWVPEIQYENQWESSDPIRIVHLLNHTTGWDEWHLRESYGNFTEDLPLKDGLDYYPHSRVSRWVPGSRNAYCNSGPAVAAYIVEKVSGITYEQYVQENFLSPLQMNNTSFFRKDLNQGLIAANYNSQLKAVPNRNLIQRPAGSISSSVSDMSQLLQFFLNRGLTDSIKLLEASSLTTMELPQSTPGAKAGLKLGYGLGCYTSTYKSHIFYGHTGGGDSFVSELAYLPENGIGHVILLNTTNQRSLSRISQLIREYETQNLETISLSMKSSDELTVDIQPGHYIAINPRIEGMYFFNKLFHIHEFNATNSYVEWASSPNKTKFYPIGPSQYRAEKLDEISLVKATDPLVGDALYLDSHVFKRIPETLYRMQKYFMIVFPVIIILLVPVVIRLFFLRSKMWDDLKMSLWPGVSSLFFITWAILLVLAMNGPKERLAVPGLFSVSQLMVSLIYLVSVTLSLIVLVRNFRRKSDTLSFYYLSLLSVSHLIVLIYLVWFGAIPSITWT
ncbi:MAG: serine hydrolase domain-containing protein [Bacteroidota bacterium]